MMLLIRPSHLLAEAASHQELDRKDSHHKLPASGTHWDRPAQTSRPSLWASCLEDTPTLLQLERNAEPGYQTMTPFLNLRRIKVRDL
jgi:hypothetical protein